MRPQHLLFVVASFAPGFLASPVPVVADATALHVRIDNAFVEHAPGAPDYKHAGVEARVGVHPDDYRRTSEVSDSIQDRGAPDYELHQRGAPDYRKRIASPPDFALDGRSPPDFRAAPDSPDVKRSPSPPDFAVASASADAKRAPSPPDFSNVKRAPSPPDFRIATEPADSKRAPSPPDF